MDIAAIGAINMATSLVKTFHFVGFLQMIIARKPSCPVIFLVIPVDVTYRCSLSVTTFEITQTLHLTP